MDHKTKKLLEQKAAKLNQYWVETGKKRPNEKFFGIFSKKGMSVALLLILLLVMLADIGIFYLLNR